MVKIPWTSILDTPQGGHIIHLFASFQTSLYAFIHLEMHNAVIDIGGICVEVRMCVCVHMCVHVGG